MTYWPLAREAGHVHICAHRGHSVSTPENTLPAIRAAAALGATVAEIDVVLTRDDQIVLLHDEILDRTTNGRGRVAAMDLEAVRQLDAGGWFSPEFAGTRVPTLEEALAAAKSFEMGLLIEIKERQRPDVMVERLARLLTATDALNDVLVISFDHISLLRLKEPVPTVRTELITHARHIDPVAIAQRARAVSVSIEWDMFHPAEAEALHAAGIAVRVTLPRPERVAVRRGYGFQDEALMLEYLHQGHIDVVAGDDTRFLTQLVSAAAI